MVTGQKSPHPSAKHNTDCLIAVILRELVFPTWSNRSSVLGKSIALCYDFEWSVSEDASAKGLLKGAVSRDF